MGKEKQEEKDIKVNKAEKDKNENVKETKVKKILEKAKKQGKITYGEIAAELDDINQDQIE